MTTIFKKGKCNKINKIINKIAFFKKRKNCDNYREINVTSSICRLYGHVIKIRIEDWSVLRRKVALEHIDHAQTTYFACNSD